MSNNVYRVSSIDENIYGINGNKLLNALVLNYANPLVSIPFLSKNEDEEKIKDLCQRVKMSYKDGNFYDVNDNLIDRNIMIDAITTDLCSSSKVFLDSKEDKMYHANMVKYVLVNSVLPMLQVKEESKVLTVDDLMAKLYNVSEEKGSMSK